ncbi:MAG: 23S rRNA (adenine(2030)-N(6))-methyltransferase RlmJ [Treponema sp.]|jgi:23S rRNA (adenine2030-N6)-methyltransferase|nr:23S rRNA (adenine(2030)-N(6))-methyltransferase RlmJ [Treponema sp.]
MLSYRHGFHAGNQADVLKHGVLIFCLDYLAQKPKPFLYVDTHAGAGFYRLDLGFGALNREWARGIGTLLPAAAENPRRPQEDCGGRMIPRYLEIAGKFFQSPAGPGYPGSPLAAAELLRPQDRACCFELHPADFAALRGCLGTDRRFRLRKEDGLEGLKSLLPPESRRALILVDPAYELKEDYQRIISVLQDGLRRFSQGLYLIWYPLLPKKGTPEYGERLMDLYRGRRCRAELRFAPLRAGAGKGRGPRMYGCGLVLYNPPWTLRPELEGSLPVLAEKLGNGGGGWELDWEEPAA